MIKISFPKDQPRTQSRQGTNEIFDTIRKKWLVLTPEEWVRQNFIQFLIMNKNYPATLIAVEKEIKLAELKKRCDIVVYNRNTQPWMIIECKEMNELLSPKVMEQILRYHVALPAKYLVITNGSHCFGFVKNNNNFVEINIFPDYEL